MEKAEQQEPQTEVWFYMGRRETTDGKLATVWLDAQGDERTFDVCKQTRAHFIGAAYDATVVRNGERVTLKGTPTWKNSSDFPPHAEAASWKAIDQAIQTTRDREALEKKRADEGDLEQALEVLRRAYRKTTPRYRSAMLANFIQTITK